ncbi:chromate transporter [bacterium]|nr:MAG: chromate transporter [bacterium]
MTARLRELAILFLKLGTTAFGGPAAHIAMLYDEVVQRRRWLTDGEFLDLLGATNLIPGPNSTEMAIHIGHRRAGWRGLVVAGVCFIAPAMLMVLALAWAYVRFGTMPEATWLLDGIKPVVVAIVARAIVSLGRATARDALAALVGLGALALSLRGADELAVLGAGGLVVLAGRRARSGGGGTASTGVAAGAALAPAAAAGMAAATAAAFSLPVLFVTFLKIGAVLYGSGYVLLAFLRADFVVGLGWLTDRQLLDAVAIGQVTPGPVFTTATFVGYVLAGVPGALVATIGIFLPAFGFVAVSGPLVLRIRASGSISALLDGVNAASLGLMAAVTLQLAGAALTGPAAVGTLVVALALMLRTGINATWLIAGGAVVGWLGAGEW